MTDFCYYGGELYHHGIKGQKWGIRRFQNPDGTLTSAGLRRQARLERVSIRQEVRNAKARAKADRKIAAIGHNKPVKKLTDDELKARISRLNMEKEYKILKADVAGISTGKEIVNKILDRVAQKEANKIKMKELETRSIEAVKRADQARQQAKQAKQQAKQAERNMKRDEINKRQNLIKARNERRKLKLTKKILKESGKIPTNKIKDYMAGKITIDQLLGTAENKDKEES